MIVAFTQLFAGYVDHFGGFSVYGALFGVVIYLTLLWGVGRRCFRCRDQRDRRPAPRGETAPVAGHGPADR